MAICYYTSILAGVDNNQAKEIAILYGVYRNAFDGFDGLFLKQGRLYDNVTNWMKDEFGEKNKNDK